MKLKQMLSIYFLSFLFCIIMLTPELKAGEKQISLIPLPAKIERHEGNFLLSKNTVIISSEAALSDYFTEQIKNLTGLMFDRQSKKTATSLIIKINPQSDNLNNESYDLSITSNQVIITSSDKIGVFRGMQTLFQLIPPSCKSVKGKDIIELPACTISDKPQFSWRGLNLDCARHFMSKDFIKRYIDILAYYKFNILHWHLTDDQGWRIEIKKYPKLTEIGAWRKEADGSVYGGFYTQEEIKEIVAYAQSRFITIVPEIEMPGHSLASLSAYPDNSCTGGPFEVANIWGVFTDIYCPGRDSTFYFLQDILDEVTGLFPGDYIHIGGDEAPKDRWKVCPKCQARITDEALKNEHELQSYFIKRISNYLYSKEKKVIGWDEILEGGLAPGAIVQSWQGFNGAIEAAKLGHYTICSPASHTYLNSSPEDLDLRVVYSFSPIPEELTTEEKKYVIGGEANLWSEQAPEETVDSKLFPRMLALSEVFWNNPQNKNYDEFYTRVLNSYEDLTALGIKFGPESKTITPETSYDEAEKEFTINIIKGQKDIEILYTIDGTEPRPGSNLYTEPIKINKTSRVKIAAYKDNQFIGKKIILPFDFHKALNSKLIITNQYNERYRASGENALIDGVRGTNNFRDGNWQGYEEVDFEALIDLGTVKEISKVITGFILDSNSWIFLPQKVIVSTSTDNINFSTPKEIINDINQKNSDVILKDFSFEFDKSPVRYIKVKAESIKVCPAWHPGAGNKAWMFIDEIVAE